MEDYMSLVGSMSQGGRSLQEQMHLHEEWLARSDVANTQIYALVQMNYNNLKQLATTQKELAGEKEENARKDKIIATTQKELAGEKEENARKDNIIASKDNIIASKSLGAFHHHYPIFENRTYTSAHHPKTHDHAEIKVHVHARSNYKESFREVQESLGCLTDFWKAGFPAIREVKDLDKSCDSETEVQNRVSDLLKSVISGLKLDDEIEVASNRTLAGVECDLLLVHRPNRLPFAPIEVKKPDDPEVFLGKELKSNERKDDHLNDETNQSQENKNMRSGPEIPGVTKENKVAGQVLDACSAVKMFGFSKVYGMLTTWNHWRLSCTQELKPLDHSEVASLKALYHSETESKLDGGQESSPPPMKIECIIAEDAHCQKRGVAVKSSRKRKIDRDGSNGDRTLDCTEVVPALDTKDFNKEGEKMVCFVAIFVLRALLSVRSLTHPQVKIHLKKSLPCRILDRENPNVFAFGSVKIENLKLSKFPDQKVKVLYVVNPLGYGDTGDCCLAVTKRGLACVVKFFRQPKEKDSIQTCAEAEMCSWNRVYSGEKTLPDCFTFDGTNGPYLVMPFLKSVPQEDRGKLLGDGTIQRTLNKFASSGFLHGDVQWRHFGWWNKELLMLDLGAVTKISNESNSGQIKKDWIKKELLLLSNRADLDPPSPYYEQWCEK